MKIIKNLNVGTKILCLVALVISFSIAGNLFIQTKIQLIGYEIEGIAERDMPLVSAITTIESHQLEQAIHVERIMRLAGIGRGSEDQVQKETDSFLKLAKQVDEELVQVEGLVREDLKAGHLSDGDKSALNEFLAKIMKLEEEHKIYDHDAEALFAAHAQGKGQAEVDHLLELTEEKQSQVNHGIDALLHEVEKFTQKALSEAEHHEHSAETTMMISMAVTAIIRRLSVKTP